jgi:hypothetical protein
MVKKISTGLIIIFLISLFIYSFTCHKTTFEPDPETDSTKTGKTLDTNGTPYEPDTTSGDTVLIGG